MDNLLKKQRKIYITAFFAFIVGINFLGILMYLLRGQEIFQGLKIGTWVIPTFTFFSIVNIICMIALFKWKKYGFWGFIISSLFTFFLSILVGFKILPTLWGLALVIVLYILLKIGSNKIWDQLE